MASTPHSPTAAPGTPVTSSDGLARLALRLDGAVTGLNSLAYLAFAAALESLLGIGASLLYPAGAFLLLFAPVVLVAGTRERVSGKALGAVLTANLLWALLSLIALVSGLLSPTLVGEVWVVPQAVVVALFAALQHAGLKRL
ncbi:hypothetical protein K378_05130 [Streptomyces sp. Amel2xB2]|uniref:hypothetical protein n=1 Tax=Streptomyces sp. Amel2xB2 TaxID=1305829 RepID=UPI000DBFCEF3|nr:hypothetical protein [Streptomyces sp. Amel2xB2]RAJ58896.1 hypothetical protein K378_05130 [Streptomyces sp. Amel2xB2]